MQKRLLFLLALLMTFMSSAMAQVTTSSLSGTVVADGEEVIGATVDVVHKPSGTHYRAVTNDKGVYTINGMRVGGPYEVTVRCIGFAEQKTGGINLQLGETFNLKTTLSETAKEMQEVMVSAKGSKFSYERTGASTNISNEQMIAMPTVSRNVTDFTRLSPYGGNGMTFQGSWPYGQLHGGRCQLQQQLRPEQHSPRRRQPHLHGGYRGAAGGDLSV